MIKYFVTSRKSPIDQTIKYYAQISSPEPIDLEAIAKRIAANCTLTRHDILACLSAFQEQLIMSLQEGKSVRLSDLGCFRVSLRSEGTEREEDFSTARIKSTHILFSPSPRLRKAVAVGADGVNFSMLEKTEASAKASTDAPTEAPSKAPEHSDGGL